MANLLLTESCVRKCPYCFAKQYMEGTEDKTAISTENLIYVVDFLERSGIKQISLLGGEPLIHPKIGDFIEYLIQERKFDVRVFTSGIMPSKKLDNFSEKIHRAANDASAKVNFIVNVNDPSISSKNELQSVYRFLSSLGKYSFLSYNIYKSDFQIDFLIEYILKFGLQRFVRFGVANPIPGLGNEYLLPTEFDKAGKNLMAGLARMYELDVYAFLDCGFPLCMFSEEDLGKLYKYTQASLRFECAPTIDIAPNLECWSCFPLSQVTRKNIKDFETYVELYSYYDKLQTKYRRETNGLYRECDSCKYFKEQLCSGGCLAHILNQRYLEGKFRNE